MIHPPVLKYSLHPLQPGHFSLLFVLDDLGWSTRIYVLVVSSDRKIVGAQRMNVIHKLRLLCN